MPIIEAKTSLINEHKKITAILDEAIDAGYVQDRATFLRTYDVWDQPFHNVLKHTELQNNPFNKVTKTFFRVDSIDGLESTLRAAQLNEPIEEPITHHYGFSLKKKTYYQSNEIDMLERAFATYQDVQPDLDQIVARHETELRTREADSFLEYLFELSPIQIQQVSSLRDANGQYLLTDIKRQKYR